LLYIIAADGGLLYENDFVISRSAVQIRVLAQMLPSMTAPPKRSRPAHAMGSPTAKHPKAMAKSAHMRMVRAALPIRRVDAGKKFLKNRRRDRHRAPCGQSAAQVLDVGGQGILPKANTIYVRCVRDGV
jgi:hypothetical protein